MITFLMSKRYARYNEYFPMDPEQHSRKIPKGADIFHTTNYGGREAVYADEPGKLIQF